MVDTDGDSYLGGKDIDYSLVDGILKPYVKKNYKVDKILASDKKAAMLRVQYYFDQARLGIGDAYVKMALYHLDGTLGKPNLLNLMTMGSMAEEYMAIPNMTTLFKNISDSDAIKIVFQALDMLNHTESEDSILARSKDMLDLGIPEGFLIQAIVSWKKGNREELLRIAIGAFWVQCHCRCFQGHHSSW